MFANVSPILSRFGRNVARFIFGPLRATERVTQERLLNKTANSSVLYGRSPEKRLPNKRTPEAQQGVAPPTQENITHARMQCPVLRQHVALVGDLA